MTRPDRGRGQARHRDLPAWPFPVLDAEQWRQPENMLRRLYLDAEAHAIEVYDWYLLDRVRKKTYSQVLRGLAVAFATAGGVIPLVSVIGGGGPSGWGYVLLALAGACVGGDHFLGLSSRWMRDMVTAQKIKQRLQQFQLDWAELNARDAVATDPAAIDVHRYLDLLRGFTSDVSGIMIEEIGEWVTEFQVGMAQLHSQTTRR